MSCTVTVFQMESSSLLKKALSWNLWDMWSNCPVEACQRLHGASLSATATLISIAYTGSHRLYGGSFYHGLDLLWVLATSETGSLRSPQVEPTVSVPGSYILGSHSYTSKAVHSEYPWPSAGLEAFTAHAQSKPEVSENSFLWKQLSSNYRWVNHLFGMILRCVLHILPEFPSRIEPQVPKTVILV